MTTYRQPFKGEYPITQKYGEVIPGVTYNNQPHTGIDYGCPMNTPILASADGIVMFAGVDNTGYGTMVIIMHKADKSTLYAHLSATCVWENQKVKQGDVIGYSGTSGNAKGPHLHFEARTKWNDWKTHFDPMLLPLMTVDNVHHTERTDLKGAEAFQFGETLSIVAPAGAKAFNNDFSKFNILNPETEVLYFGESKERNGYTYLRCILSCWIAVNDGDCQILDK